MKVKDLGHIIRNMRTISVEELKRLYHEDFPLWAEINHQLLKEKAYELVDWENLLEEIEDMAQKHLDSCISQLARILEHLYKWDNFRRLSGGEKAGMGWIKSVESARLEILAMLDVYPSLRNRLPLEIEKAWKFARRRIQKWLIFNDHNPEDFPIPEDCPYTFETAMNRDLRRELS